MTMHFGSLADLAQHMLSETVQELHGAQRGLEQAAVLIEQTAKAEIGEYQDAVGPFEAWAPLAESTEADKAAKGYPPDAPLLRKGDLRESIQHEVKPLEAIIGSIDPVMVFHEFGTSKMPARPVLGPALHRNEEKIKKLVGHAAAAGLVGEDPIHESLGYDREI